MTVDDNRTANSQEEDTPQNARGANDLAEFEFESRSGSGMDEDESCGHGFHSNLIIG